MIIGKDRVQKAIAKLGEQLTERLTPCKHVCFVTVLQGGMFFAVDLIRATTTTQIHRVSYATVTCKSYNHTTQEPLKITQFPAIPAGVDVVVLIDDILDSGATLKALENMLRPDYKVITAVLLDKEIPDCKTKADLVAIKCDSENYWWAGMGMDGPNGHHRELTYLNGISKDWV